jgi:hypothetical protein
VHDRHQRRAGGQHLGVAHILQPQLHAGDVAAGEMVEVISLLERKKKKEGENARLRVLRQMNWILFKRRWLNSIK